MQVLTIGDRAPNTHTGQCFMKPGENWTPSVNMHSS